MRNPKGDSVASVFVAVSAAGPAKKLPAVTKAVDERESATYFCFDVINGDCPP